VLLLAVRFAKAGQLQAGDVALVSAYLLMLNYPTTRVGRQITRLGPQITSAERLARLAEPPPQPVAPAAAEPAVLTAVPMVAQPQDRPGCLHEQAPELAVRP
jgi:hypothetical protein